MSQGVAANPVCRSTPTSRPRSSASGCRKAAGHRAAPPYPQVAYTGQVVHALVNTADPAGRGRRPRRRPTGEGGMGAVRLLLGTPGRRAAPARLPRAPSGEPYDYDLADDDA
ncbi:hypothetical protein GCM10022419_108760 [Nonomuraea rosea]|uniref:Uncharacterized protein n=1 Tax=Nonomuraea rosea TaxID=638574 RepID=A0ABP6ZFM8_9ACTN